MKHEDPAAFLPFRFLDAFDGGEVSVRQLALAAYLIGKCYERRNLSDGWATIRTSDMTARFDVSADTIGRDLHAFAEAGWVQCDVSAGQRGGWRVRLTGLASPAQPPQDLRKTSAKDPPVLRRLTSARTSAEGESGNGASADAERGSAAPEPPQEPPQERTAGSDTRPDPTRPLALREDQREDLGSLRGDGLRNFRPLAFHEHLIEQVAAGAVTQAEAAELWSEHKAGKS